MIVHLPIKDYDQELIHTYSDLQVKIKQVETGLLYNYADDVLPCEYTYEETNILIPVEER